MKQDNKFLNKECEKCSQPLHSGWDSYIDIYWFKCDPCNIFYTCDKEGNKFD